MKRLCVSAAAILLVLVIAGCGGDGGGGGDRLSKADYQSEVEKVGDTLNESVSKLGTAFAGGSPDSLDQVSGEVDKLADAVDAAADELDDLNPPEDAAEAHDKLVDGMHGFADDLRDLADSAEDGNLQAMEEFSENFDESDSTKKIEEATEELEAKGYGLED